MLGYFHYMLQSYPHASSLSRLAQYLSLQGLGLVLENTTHRIVNFAMVFWGHNTQFVVGLIGMVSLEFRGCLYNLCRHQRHAWDN